MFWSRRIRPPLTTFQRVDIELLMRRSVETIGKDRVCRNHLVMDVKELPLDSSSHLKLLRSATTILAEFLPPMPARVELQTGDLEKLAYPAVYRPASEDRLAQIVIANELLEDPLRTLMELAYQHALHFWHHVSDPRPLDTHPRTTHLLPVCCGLGILASDASFYDQQWSRLGYSGWSMSRAGYYTAEEIGYALALFAQLRCEDHPSWLARLRLDSLVTAQQALRYFSEQQQQGRSILFNAEQIPTSQTDSKQLAAWLRGDDPAFALAGAYALSQQNEASADVVEAAIEASHSDDRDLAQIATKLLALARVVTNRVRDRVTELIVAKHPATALAAVQAAQVLGIPLKDQQRRIARLLKWCGDDCFDLLEVIGSQGQEFAWLAPQICKLLATAVQSADDELASALIQCLREIAENPIRVVERQVRSGNVREEIIRRLAAVS